MALIETVPFDQIYSRRKPTKTLLQRWAKRVKEGHPFTPVFRRGKWYVYIERGHKSALLVPIPFQ